VLPRLAIRSPRLSCAPGAGLAPSGVRPGKGDGAVAVGPVRGDPAAESLPYRPMLGSGALRTSGKSVWAGSRLALSTKGMGTWVTNRATATAATRPKI